MESGIASIYQQYKADTTRLVDWLGKAAVNCGFPTSRLKRTIVETDSDLTENSNGGPDDKINDANAGRTAKQLRNARKKAAARQKALADDSNRAPSTISGTYDIPTMEFVPMAHHLAANQVAIPESVNRLAKRCIAYRRRAMALLGGQQERIEGGHKHFIHVLQDTLDVLHSLTSHIEPSITPRSMHNSAAATGTDDDTPTSTSNNPYAVLQDLEDDMDSDIDLPAPPILHGQAGTPAAFGVELGPEQAMEHAYMFMGDFAGVRNYIRGIWERYRTEKIDIATASIVTDMGLELLMASHHHFRQRALPKLGGLPGLYRSMEQDSGGKDAQVGGQDNVGDLCRVWRVLNSVEIHITVSAEDLSQVKEAGSARYDPVAWGISAAEDYEQELRLLHSLIAHCALSHLQSEHSFLDIFSVGLLPPLKQFVQSGTVELMTAMSALVHIDINRTLQSSAVTAFAILCSSTVRMQRNLASVTDPEFGKSIEDELGPDNLELYDATTSWFDETSQQYRTLLHMGEDNPYISNPVLCGLIVLNNFLLYRKVGLRVVNSYGIVQAAAATHNVFRLGGRSDLEPIAEWPDMEAVERIFGAPALYGSEKPHTAVAAWVSFLRILGRSSPDLKLMSRAYNGLPPQKSYQRKIRRGAGVIQVDGDINDHINLEDEPSDLLPFLSDLLGDPRDGPTTGTSTLKDYILKSLRKHLQDLDVAQAAMMSDSRKAAGQALERNRRTRRAQRFSTAELLSELERRLASDFVNLAFDYLSLHQRCSKLYLSAYRDVVSTLSDPAQRRLHCNPLAFFLAVIDGAARGVGGEHARLTDFRPDDSAYVYNAMRNAMIPIISDEGGREIAEAGHALAF